MCQILPIFDTFFAWEKLKYLNINNIMTLEIHRVKNAISTIFCTKTTDRCVKGKNPLGIIPHKDGFAYDENVCYQFVFSRGVCFRHGI